MQLPRNHRTDLIPGTTSRRDFLHSAGAAAAVGLAAAASGCSVWRPAREREIRADVVIVGAGVGGCAAALAACRMGRSVVLTEPTEWVGGQLTSQGVPPDEHPWIEQFGCTRSYRQFRDDVRRWYQSQPGLVSAARTNPRLNPGNGWVSRLCHEPRVAHSVLRAQLAPHIASGRLRLLTRHELRSAITSKDRVKAVTVRDLETGHNRVLVAPWFIDATELGDLLPLAGIEHVIGAESRRDTGELHAPETANPLDQQSFTWCFALEYRPDLRGSNLISKPAEYAFWRDYVPAMTPAWSGKLFAWFSTHPITLAVRPNSFDPSNPSLAGNLWTYRRIVDASLWSPSAGRHEVSLVNWPQNDYWLGPLVGVEPSVAQHHLQRSRELSLSFVYWMQTEAPRPDGGTGWPEVRLSPEVMGTSDGLAMAPYIRESRRIRAEFTVLEQHVGVDARSAATGLPKDRVTAERFHDSVGVGGYRIDLHPGTGGGNYIDVGSLPFEIPLGALIPRRVENVLAGAKNLGVTHLTNGCYRLHPVEWNIGEAAGALAAWCAAKHRVPTQVRNSSARLAEFQSELDRQGVERTWPASPEPKLHPL